MRDELRAYGAVYQPSVVQKSSDPVTSHYKARSSGPLRFHTDRADVVGLLCVRQARAGGASKIVSSVAIHDAILARRPDLHALLCQDYYRTREGEEVGGNQSWYALPVFSVRDGRWPRSPRNSATTPAPRSRTIQPPAATDCCSGCGSRCRTAARCRRALWGSIDPGALCGGIAQA